MRKKQNIFLRMFSFSGEIGMGEFWSGIGMRLIGVFCAMIVLCIAIAVVVPGDTEKLIAITNWVVPVFGIVWMLPVIPQTRRRLRDAGHTAKSYFWLLLPVVGWIWFVVLLCKRSAETVK